MRIDNQCTLKRKKERLFVSTETFEERKPEKKRKDSVQHETFDYIFLCGKYACVHLFWKHISLGLMGIGGE